MAKDKKFVEQHNKDLNKLADILADARELYVDSTITAAEFVGALEMAKFYVMNRNMREFEACLDGGMLAELVEELFGEGEEGEDA